MDPVSLILQALVTGATKVAGDSVQDAYKGLKKSIQRKFADKPVAQTALVEHEKQPEVWKEPLKAGLVEAGADKDEEIIKKAQELLKAVDPQGAAAGAYNVTVAGNVYGVAGENKGTVNQTFNK